MGDGIAQWCVAQLPGVVRNREFGFPQAFIAKYATTGVDIQSRNKWFIVNNRPVTKTSLGFARVSLVERFQSQFGKTQPRASHWCAVADVEAESPDRQCVRRGREPQVNVERAGELTHRLTIQCPVSGSIGSERDPDGTATGVSIDYCRPGAPGRIAIDHVSEARDDSRLLDHDLARQMPAGFRLGDPCLLTAGDVEASPDHA